MARSGLYKSDVKKARDALIAQGKHPSVDAVRIALGNTGSKTTIHKYLKELENEEGDTDNRKASISETIQDLVERLAAQLQEEAGTAMELMRTQFAEQERLQKESASALEKALAAAQTQIQQLEITLQEERTAYARTRDALQMETVARHTADQQVIDIKERLSENNAHRRSLEEKHQHAREALEHYRQSVKEQRDQDQRRHEQQLQQLQAELRTAQQTIIIKQEEVTRLNQEGVRLIADLTHVRQALQESEENSRRQAQKLEQLQAIEQRHTLLTAQVAEKERQTKALLEQLTDAGIKLEALSNQIRTLELAEAAAQAKLSAQQEMTAELRTLLNSR
jgi:chromosome segregation ATPase